MEQRPKTRPIHAAVLFLAAVVLGCSRQSAPPIATPSPSAPTTSPAIATTLPATLPAGSYRVASETTFGRSDNGRLIYDPIEAGTLVVLLRADPEWSRVRTPNGQEGLVPTFRLEPKICFEAPVDPVAQLAAAPVNSFVAGPAAPPAVPNFTAGEVAKLGSPAGGDMLPERVRAAVERAIKYVESQRQGDNWEAVADPQPADPSFTGERWGQLTALSTYALLRTGEASKLAGCFTWLRKASITSPSVVALRAQISATLPGEEFDPHDKSNPINIDTRLLMQAMVNPGLTAKPVPADKAASEALYYLNANQSAVAGMAALERAGAEFPLESWRTIEQASARAQKQDGSWIGPEAAAADRARVTGAGVATRMLISEKLYPDPRGVGCLGAITDCCLLSGAQWLDGNASDALSDPAAMWAVEQAALATGRKYFGTIDWYRTAAESLLKTQNPNGSWPPAPGADPAGRSIPETAYALLFLAEGSSPLIINKLDYQSKPDPNTGARHFGPAQQRPRDLVHLAAWTGRWLEMSPLPRWQWVNFSMPAADFQEAPVLYIAGSEPLDFTPAEVDLLRNYVQRGGLIVGNADCASAAFSRSFLALGRQLWPKYEFRPITPDHPLLTNEAFKSGRWRQPATVLGLTNGVRELMLLVPDADLSRAWQTDSTVARRDRFELGMNILLYAKNSNDWPNRSSPLLLPDNKIVPTRAIRVARLDYLGNCDPEPGGWERLSALMHNQFATKLDVAFVKPTARSLTQANPPFQVASLTGTGEFNLSDEARAEIAAFVNAGGTLIVDAAGGNEKFVASAEAELSAMFPPPQGQVVATVLAPKDAVYTLKAGQINHFGYRRFVRTRFPGHLILPRVQGITVGNRIAVFYSPQDLSNGLVGQETDGVIGYDPETATAIMRNLLLYAAGER